MSLNYLDDNGLLYLIQKIKMWDSDKVDKVTGKGLSTNDFDATYKAALDNLATNYVAAVSGKGLSTNDFDNTYKAALDGLATNYVAAVSGKGLSTNDYDNTEKAKVAAAQTASDVQTAIQTALASFVGIDFQIVADLASLPATGSKGIFYLVPNGSGNDSYDEYIWLTINAGTEQETSRYEKIGKTTVDLTGYVQTTDLVAITNNEIDTIVTSASSAS